MDQSDVVIVGGGAAGLTVAALLKKHRRTWRISVVEPSATHYYQPGFTIVGGGAFTMAQASRPTRSLMPRGVNWVRSRAARIDPAAMRVHTDDGGELACHHLVVCPGLVNDLARVEGLAEALGRDGVTSNYVVESVPYTWQLIDAWRGGRAVFTQPPLPFKCPGAPQKIAYLAADRWRRRGLLERSELHFHTAAAAMFGIPEFARALDKVVQRYGIRAHFAHNLVAVDARRRVATFERAVGEQKQRVEQEYELLHVSPPESPPAFLRDSQLVNAAGFVEVDHARLQHPRFGHVFALGDACSAPNSKTAAAVRKQAPQLVANLLAHADGRELTGVYDGYGSCPLTTSLSTVMLAEFVYGGKITPTFRMDPFAERRLWWLGKRYGLPALYWQMLRGLEFDIAHAPDKARQFLPA
jgi:sulfide:quinone oxidoreductase